MFYNCEKKIGFSGKSRIIPMNARCKRHDLRGNFWNAISFAHNFMCKTVYSNICILVQGFLKAYNKDQHSSQYVQKQFSVYISSA